MAAGRIAPHWEEPAPVEVPAALRDAVGGPPVLSETLVRRGHDTPERALAFLEPRHYRPAAAADLPDMMAAADRIERALRDGERIGVWGDFDVDGQTSTTLLVETLRRLGADPAYHIPVRATESHGVGVEALRGFLDSGVTLMLTCDTGVDDNEAVEYAAGRGVDVIITDHHDLPPELPPALAVINPKRIDGPHPLRALPGVGVAFQVARELFGRAGRIEESRELLDLVALGVVADLAEQVDDTRFWLQVGLMVLRRTERVGLQVMMELAELNRETLAEEQISFALGPRLNAIGRLGDANPIVELMTTDSREAARAQVEELERMNARRRLLTDQVFDAACDQIDADPGILDHPGLVLFHADWPPGVIGIVASRLVERFHRPTLLLAAPDGPVRGSARSISGCNVTAAIAACAELLDGYGGHPMAAGVSLQPERLEPFRRELQAALREQIGDGPPAPRLPIDGVLDLGQTDLDLVAALAGLGPFGPGNRALTFASHGVTIKGVTEVGRGGDHRKMLVADRTGATRSVMWWQSGGDLPPEGHIDLAYRISAHDYRGSRSLQVEWIDARPAAAPTAIVSGPEQPAVVDHRAGTDAAGALAELANGVAEPPMIWGEDGVAEPATGRDRIGPAQTLVVWTTPPGRAELQHVLRRAQPRALHLFAVDPETAPADRFMASLAGMCKHALRHHEGRIAIGRLAAALAHREATVRAGLAWLAARGDLTVVRQDAESVTLADGGQADPTAAERSERDVRDLLTETAAYRRFYAKTPLDELMRTL